MPQDSGNNYRKAYHACNTQTCQVEVPFQMEQLERPLDIFFKVPNHRVLFRGHELDQVTD